MCQQMDQRGSCHASPAGAWPKEQTQSLPGNDALVCAIGCTSSLRNSIINTTTAQNTHREAELGKIQTA